MAARLKLGAQALALAAVAALLALLVWKLATQGGGVKVGKRAPNFTFARLDAPGKLSLASLRGKAVVLNFWASWCIPCKQESPRLQRFAHAWAKRGVVVLGVDTNDFAGDAKQFMRRYGLTYPNVHDGHGLSVHPYGLTGFPETFFVGRSGRLVGDHVEGPVTEKQLRDNVN